MDFLEGFLIRYEEKSLDGIILRGFKGPIVVGLVMSLEFLSGKFRLVGTFIVLGGLLLVAREHFFEKQIVRWGTIKSPRNPHELTIFYHERSPYYFTEDKQVKGLVVEPVVAALARAGIRFRWEVLPPARQLREIAENERPIAAVGWFSNEERRRFAQFSDVIYEDGAWVVVTRIDNKKIWNNQALDTLLADKSQTLLVKDSYSYGMVIDGKLAAWKTPRVSTPGDNFSMIRMLVEGRADYTLFPPSEVREIVAEFSEAARLIKSVHLSDAPRGGQRHLMFSRKVSETLVERFNTALRATAFR